ncbi:hypothetical protein HJC23_008694 [Cyclotella cryptica]|uniref:Uncharacterized protein n=1 Tax=Cyclotella cryptica TaxID=29204 RepID=A0ABD3QHC7_9STRA|eukprot:CCRYP_005409-RA/>CCRYP_005409-RA protein AED:0.03 eAED:0.03 QI:89/1/1/1/0.66/0.5/4/2899/361
MSFGKQLLHGKLNYPDPMKSSMNSDQLYHNTLIQESEPRKQDGSVEEGTGRLKQEPLQIQVSSTFDADMILRKIIEDRSAILALRSEADRNENELLKAKAWQMQTSEQLLKVEKEISRHIAKAKYDISEYNESSKQYINGFIAAFQNGDIEKLRHHPFVPSLKELEESISLRKALVIEKVQADDRVRKLEIISSRHHIAKTVLRKNEEAFVRAIAIAKQKFSDSCGSWLHDFEALLLDLPGFQGTAGKRDKISVRVRNGGNETADSKKATQHAGLTWSKGSLKRPPPEEEDLEKKHKRHETIQPDLVGDIRHENSDTRQEPSISNSIGAHANSEPSVDFTRAHADFLNDVAIAEALTRLGG